MRDFTYYSPTRIIFEEGAYRSVGKYAKEYSSRVLLVYGSASAKKSGVYDAVVASLKEYNIEITELSGIVPNPRLSRVYEGIALCKEKDIGLVLGLGGGSVIDTAKAIAIGARQECDVWELFKGGVRDNSLCIPIGVILTIPAAGSESSNSCVITNEETGRKLGYRTDTFKPSFAVLSPELTLTLSPYQTACGIADMMAHLMERYFSREEGTLLSDKLIEGAIQSIIALGRKIIETPNDLNTRKELMWASTLAHNGLFGMGRCEDWSVHALAHEISALNDTAHGACFAILYPHWIKYTCSADIKRAEGFFKAMFGTSSIDEGCAILTDFYKALKLPTRLSEVGINKDDISVMAHTCATRNPSPTIGNFMPLTEEDALRIYLSAL